MCAGGRCAAMLHFVPRISPRTDRPTERQTDRQTDRNTHTNAPHTQSGHTNLRDFNGVFQNIHASKHLNYICMHLNILSLIHI